MLLASLLKPFRFRGKARLLHSTCPKKGVRAAKVFGYDVSLDLANYIERCMYLNIFEPSETALLRKLLKPGMTVVDAGANVGYYTLMAASRVGPDGHVFAFEPSPRALNKLRKTVAENQIDNVTLSESALGDSEGTAELYIPETDNGNHTPSMVAQDFSPTAIAVTTLDSFLERHRVFQVDLLKLDVEGFEPNIIRGAQRALASGRVKAILCEFNEHWLTANGGSSKALLTSLETAGFRQHRGRFVAGQALQNLLMVHD